MIPYLGPEFTKLLTERSATKQDTSKPGPLRKRQHSAYSLIAFCVRHLRTLIPALSKYSMPADSDAALTNRKPATSNFKSSDIADNSDLRAAISDAWFITGSAPEHMVLEKRPSPQAGAFSDIAPSAAIDFSSYPPTSFFVNVSKPEPVVPPHYLVPPVRSREEVWSLDRDIPELIDLLLASSIRSEPRSNLTR